MNRAQQHPLQGFLAALAAVAVLSIMDAVMKHLVLVIGLVAVSVWRSAANLALSAILYLRGVRHGLTGKLYACTSSAASM